DELGAGYARYLVCLFERALREAVGGEEDPVGEGAQRTAPAVSLSELLPSLGQLRQYAPMLEGFLGSNLFGPDSSRYYALVRRGDPSRLLTPDVLTAAGGYDPAETYQQVFARPNTTSYLNRMLYFDAKAMLPALLHVEDRTSMAVSLESRVPLLDHRIAEP